MKTVPEILELCKQKEYDFDDAKPIDEGHGWYKIGRRDSYADIIRFIED